MPLFRNAPAQLIALAVAVGTVGIVGIAGCGKEDAPKPAASPSAPAQQPAPAPKAAAPNAPAPTAQPAGPAPSAPDPDKALAAKVKAALEAATTVTGQQIDVTAKGGTVTLWGTVGDPAEQAKAVEAAKAVPGVKAVDNKLAIVKGS